MAVLGPNTNAYCNQLSGNMDKQQLEKLEQELKHLISVNYTYQLFICPHEGCRKAVQRGAYIEHLRVQHKTALRDRQRIQELIVHFDWEYSFSNVPLPRHRSRPQPILPVSDALQCQDCPYICGTRKGMKVHGNGEHNKKRVSDDRLFRKVRVQSWFQDHRQRYWVVDESLTPDADDEHAHIITAVSEERDHYSDISTVCETKGGPIEAAIAVDDREEEIENGKSIADKDVIESIEYDDEDTLVLSDLEDSADDDYRESSADASAYSIASSSEGEEGRGDDKEYETSSWGTNESEGSFGSDIDESVSADESGRATHNADEELVRSIVHSIGNPKRKEMVRKRKVQSRIEESDSDDGTYGDFSPGISIRQAHKRRRREAKFEDSGVVMGSSQDDQESQPGSQGGGSVHSSSPPVFRWMTEGGPGGSDSPELPRTTSRVIMDDDRTGHAEAHQPDGYVRSRLEQLQARLEQWCQTCAACCLAQDARAQLHCITDCQQHDTVDIVTQSTMMQQHIVRSGGFEGRDGCPWCGVPRAICYRWKVDISGAWEIATGQRCQYMARLVPAVITMMTDGSKEGWAVVENWMNRDNVLPNKQAEVCEWFRQGRRWNDVGGEVSQMVRVFNMLVNKNRGVCGV
jgi:hypothetical protein